MTGIHDHDLIADDEIPVAAPFRMDLDQDSRDFDDAHMRGHRGADADCEVDTISAGDVPARQHSLLNAGALLGREIHARARLRLTLLGLALSGLILRLVLTRLSLLRLTLIALLVLPFRRATLTGLALVALTLARGLVGLTATISLPLLALALIALLGLALLALTLITLLRLALLALALIALLGLTLLALALVTLLRLALLALALITLFRLALLALALVTLLGLALFALALVTLLRLTLLALALLLSAAILCRLRLLGLLTPALAALTAGTPAGHVLRRSKSYAGHQGGRRQ